MRTALFWVVTQPAVVNFLPTFREKPIGPNLTVFYSWTLKVGPIGCPETPGRNFHYSVRNNTQEHSSQLLRGGSL